MKDKKTQVAPKDDKIYINRFVPIRSVKKIY